jgi:hypothetical protein
MQSSHLITALALLGTANISLAASIDNLGGIGGQANFKLLSEDLSSTFSYKAVIPATPLGLTGIDLGVEASSTKLKNPTVWQAATSSNDTTIIVPKVHVHKGLPFGFDVGGFYTAVPSSNIKLIGAEVRYALFEGGVITPAIGLRGAYTKLSGVDQLALNTKGLEVLVSKGFVLFTPYLGIGHVWTSSDPQGIAGLQKETISQNKTFAGVNMNLGLMNFALEGDKTGDTTSYSFKFGFRF